MRQKSRKRRPTARPTPCLSISISSSIRHPKQHCLALCLPEPLALPVDAAASIHHPLASVLLPAAATHIHHCADADAAAAVDTCLSASSTLFAYPSLIHCLQCLLLLTALADSFGRQLLLPTTFADNQHRSLPSELYTSPINIKKFIFSSTHTQKRLLDHGVSI